MKQRCHKSHYKKGKTVMTVKLRFDEADHDCPELICYLADKFLLKHLLALQCLQEACFLMTLKS